jgi:hypothetical protein
MPEFEAKLREMDQELRQAEEQAQQGARQDEAFAIAMRLEQSELNTIYRDLVIMGRAAVKLMARHMDQSLSIPKHQQEFIEGAKRFVAAGPVREQIETWGGQLAKSAA